MKYDIPILLALRHNACIDVEKFSSQALGNNLFRRRKFNSSTSVLSERTANRSRNTSNFSSRSEAGSSTAGGSQRQRLPFRQPSNPPEGAPAQTDTGFARFLKEHASPKHQRVTAGGRIVPMDPVTPAPKMKLPMPMKRQNTDTNRASASTSLQSELSGESDGNPFRDSEINTGNDGVLNTSSVPVGLTGDPQKPPPGYADYGPQLHAPGLLSNFPSLIPPSQFLHQNVPLPFDNRQFLQPEQRAHDYIAVLPNYGVHGITSDPLAWLPNLSNPSSSQDSSLISVSSSQPRFAGSAIQSDGSASSGLFGMSNQQFFNPVPHGSGSFYPFHGRVDSQFISNQFSTTNQPPISGTSHEKTRWRSLQDARKEYETLSTQLSRLDRYMALRTWELNSRSKRLLVEQRIDLVKKLDAVRSYKEELESVLAASRPGTFHTGKKASTELPAASSQFAASGVTNHNQTMQMPWLSNMVAPDFDPSALYPSVLANTLPTPLPVNDPFGRTFQGNGKEYPYSLDNSQRLADELTDVSNNHYGTDIPCRERMNKNPESVRNKTQTLATSSTETKSGLDNGDKCATPTTSSPPNIHGIYRQIEEAISRGESVEGLLKELTAITARNARKSNISSGSPQPIPKRAVKPVSSNKPYDSRTSQNAYVDHVRSNTDSVYIENMTRNNDEDPRPAAHTSRKPWRSEEGTRFASEAVDEDDVGTCSSYASTDSWATLQDGDNDLPEKHPEQKGKTEQQTGTCGVPDADTRAHAFNAPFSMGLTSLSNRMERSREEIGIHKPPRKAALSSSPANSASQTMPNNMKTPCPQFVAQCLNNRHGFVSQKTPAVAVSQKVNAHAFLPPFDGAADESGGLQTDQNLENHYRQADLGTESHHRKSPWCINKQDKPSPAILRGFFRRIQEERNI